MRHFWHCIVLAALLATVASAQDEPKKITRATALSAVATKVQPDYPPVARQLRIQGTVELQVLVAETGEVLKVDIVSGSPMFTGPAAQAVKRWKFRPFVENGKPVRVLAPVTVDFKM
jgi:protein TonB